MLVHQEVEEDLAFEEIQDPVAQVFDDELGRIAGQQLAGGFGQQFGPPLGLLAVGDVAAHDAQANRFAPGVLDVEHIIEHPEGPAGLEMAEADFHLRSACLQGEREEFFEHALAVLGEEELAEGNAARPGETVQPDQAQAALIHVEGDEVPAAHRDEDRAVLSQGNELVALQVGLGLGDLQAQRPEAEGDVVGQLSEQLDLVLGECVRLLRIDGDGAEGPAAGQQRHGNGRGIATLDGFGAPGGKRGIRECVSADAGLADADGGTRGAAAEVGIGPGDAQGLQVALLEARIGSRPDALLGVVLGESEPDHRMAAVLDDDLAYLGQVFRFGGGAYHGKAAVLQGLQDAAEPEQAFLVLTQLGADSFGVPAGPEGVLHQVDGGLARSIEGGIGRLQVGIDPLSFLAGFGGVLGQAQGGPAGGLEFGDVALELVVEVAHGLVGLLAPGDVGQERIVIFQLALRIPRQVDQQLDGHPATVLTHVFLLVADGLAGAGEFLQVPALHFAPFGRGQGIGPAHGVQLLRGVASQLLESGVQESQAPIRIADGEWLGGPLDDGGQELVLPLALPHRRLRAPLLRDIMEDEHNA